PRAGVRIESRLAVLIVPDVREADAAMCEHFPFFRHAEGGFDLRPGVKAGAVAIASQVFPIGRQLDEAAAVEAQAVSELVFVLPVGESAEERVSVDLLPLAEADAGDSRIVAEVDVIAAGLDAAADIRRLSLHAQREQRQRDERQGQYGQTVRR